MAIITFSIKDLGIDNVEEIAERLGLDFEGREGEYISLDIPPNRPDLLDFFGLRRAMLNYLQRRTPKESDYLISNPVETSVTVSKNVSKVRPFISAFVVKGVQLSERSLKYIINFTEKLSETYGRKRKKMALGLHNYDAIKGPLIYDASETGKFIPLGSEKEMNFEEIIHSHSKGIRFGDTIPRIKGKILYPFLKDSEKILSMIPIINSRATAIDENTRNIFVDVTGTSESTVRSTASMLAASFLEQKGSIYPVEIRYPNRSSTQPEMSYTDIKVNLNKIDGTLGFKFVESLLITYANRMGYPASKYGSYLLVRVPPYRLDVFNYQDVIEDIAMGFGYENIRPLPVRSTAIGLPNELQEYENRLVIFMVGLGYMEVVNNYLTNEELSFGRMLHNASKNVVSIAYSKTENITMLRSELLPSLLQNLGRSAHERMPQKIFEVGSVFSVSEGEAIEKVNLAFAAAQPKSNFADAKSVLSAILDFLHINYELKEEQDNSFIEGRCAGVYSYGKRVGIIGEIHPSVLNNFKIAEPTVAGELTLLGKVSYFNDK
ncbi:MAG: phenylalanine--tRNA ligase subunit beta [Candidatus Micrarchaeaceae archaeon]